VVAREVVENKKIKTCFFVRGSGDKTRKLRNAKLFECVSTGEADSVNIPKQGIFSHFQPSPNSSSPRTPVSISMCLQQVVDVKNCVIIILDGKKRVLLSFAVVTQCTTKRRK